MERVRQSLPFALAFNHLLHFALLRSARDIGGSLRLRRRCLALGAFQFLSFGFVGDFFGVHSILIPAYFATSFFNPYPGKLTVTLVSSPEPSRRNTVPRPYLACSMVEPGPTFFFCCGGLTAAVLATAGCWEIPDGAGMPRSAKNCLIFSTEL